MTGGRVHISLTREEAELYREVEANPKIVLQYLNKAVCSLLKEKNSIYGALIEIKQVTLVEALNEIAEDADEELRVNKNNADAAIKKMNYRESRVRREKSFEKVEP